MATRLYPPNLENTIPAFYGTSIEVPFSMNSTVSRDQIEGFMLQIKSLTSNSALIDNIISNNFNIEKQKVKFVLPQEQVNKLNVGQYYKLQIAYLPQGYSSERSVVTEQEVLLQKINDLAPTSNTVEESIQALKSLYRQALQNYRKFYLDSDEVLLQQYSVSNDDDWSNYWTQVCLQQLQQDIITQLKNAAQTNLDPNSVEKQKAKVKNVVDAYLNEVTDENFASRYAALKSSLTSIDIETVNQANLEANTYRSIFEVLSKGNLYNNQIELNIFKDCDNDTVVTRGKEYYNQHVSYPQKYDPTTLEGFKGIKDLIVDKMTRAIKVCRQEILTSTSELYPIVGYFSTAAIVKYTSVPTVEIQGLKSYSTAAQQTDYVGEYSSSDPTERVKYYSFYLRDENGKIVDSVTDSIHNSNSDTVSSTAIKQSIRSSDLFSTKIQMNKDKLYTVQYVVKTTNNMTLTSPIYNIIRRAMVPLGDIQFYATPHPDYGYISLELDYSNSKVDRVGTYLLSRTYKKDGVQIKEKLKKINLAYDLSMKNPYNDYTIEHGIKYEYIIERINNAGVYSLPVLAKLGPVPTSAAEQATVQDRPTEISASFEDAFLYDGKRQLRIRYNPKISSFKKDVLETKTDTIGGKFPFIFRNGSVSYKEFPISGLISRLENECFDLGPSEPAPKRESTVSSGSADSYSLTDLSDENICAERQFKMEVLDFLTDGKPKLFRSPTEGNYLVRLMNTSLTPEDTLGRMLHTFSCTAYEIGECDYDTLLSYGIISGGNEVVNKVVSYTSVNITPDTQKGKNLFTELGSAILSVSIDHAPAGSTVLIDDEKIMIGATGMYEVPFGSSFSSIKLPTDDSAPTSGVITVAYESYTESDFDKITEATVQQLPIDTVFGHQDTIVDTYTPLILSPELKEEKGNSTTNDDKKQMNKKQYISAIRYLRFLPRPFEHIKISSANVFSDNTWLQPRNNIKRPIITYLDENNQKHTNFESFPYISRLPIYYFTSDNLPWYIPRKAGLEAKMQAFDLGYFYKPADEDDYTFHRWAEKGSYLLPIDYFKNDSLYDVIIAYGDGHVRKFSVAPQHPIEISGGDLRISAISIGAAVYMEAGYEMAENSFVDEMNKLDTELISLRQAYQSAQESLLASRDEPISRKATADSYLDWYVNKLVLERKYNYAKDAYFKAVEERRAKDNE